MDIKKIGEPALPLVTGTKTASKAAQKPGGNAVGKPEGNNVTTSPAGAAMSEFRQSLLNTISSGSLTQSGGLYQLVNTPVDKFITKSFSGLAAKDKKEFMNLFTGLTQRSYGFVSQDIIEQSFGTQGNFGDLIAQIGTKLNARLK